MPVTILSRCQRFDLRRVDAALLVERCAHPRIVGLGESGLDYHYDHSDRGRQQANFRAHIAAAAEALALAEKLDERPYQPGSPVNLETDILARHVQRLLAFPPAAPAAPTEGGSQ